ncbi:hypothetical protein K504DRAFT_494986 [Pleomassaria siparia CBS 279.74]|uniref:AB hydrolase-1 domain-containing protein n=1 Tax=Pleomassaria siparia CBS 279.74 TaxID=1314801 RepID=A0A6G1JUF8_9PLEO|nr:hypothetical protein K504DRAFT_494986 [Pleomassaria siparia CBS 279.74]
MNLLFVLVMLLPSDIFLLIPIAGFAFFGLTGAIQQNGNPAIILVPGAFHQASIYDKVISILHEDGYSDTTAVNLPSVGSVVGREPDIEAVRSLLLQKLTQGIDVLLVGNSYGATVIGEAVKDLKEYQAPEQYSVLSNNLDRFSGHGYRSNNRGQILGLVFFAGYIPKITDVTQPETKLDIHLVSPSFFRFSDDGKVFWDNDLEQYPPAVTFYNDLSSSEQKEWSQKLNFSSFDALNAYPTYIPYTGDFKCTYVIGEKDFSVPPSLAESLIGQEGAIFTVQRLADADHVPMLSRPDEVVEEIQRAIGYTKKE